MPHPHEDRLRRARSLGQDGCVLPLTAIAMTALIGVAALAVDLGGAYVVRSQMQTAADFAALAAVRVVGDATQVTAEATSFAGQNLAPAGYDASVIAEATGLTTVADFRRRDVASGGQGAPLMPAFHAAVLRSPDEDRAILNLGGIASLTLLPRDGAVRTEDGAVRHASIVG